MSRFHSAACLLALGLLCAAPSASADDEPDAAACVAIVNATAWLPQGRVLEVTVVLRGDRVEAAGVRAPHRCERIVDGAGKVITAGLVDPYTHLGTVEVGMSEPTVDSHPHGQRETPKLGVFAAFQVVDAYNPLSSLVRVARLGGVTAVVTVPSGGVISGQSAWVDLHGTTQAAATERRSVALHAGLAGGDLSRATLLHLVRSVLAEARFHRDNEQAWVQAQRRPLQFSHLDLTALRPVLSGELPLAVQVDRAADIEALMRLSDDFSVRLILVGGAEAWIHAAELARRKIPVIVDPLRYAPLTFDQVHARADNAALLNAAGVPLLMSAFSSHNVRSLRQVAGNAVRAGLPQGAAIRAITRTPAEVFGVVDHGHLVPGAAADVVVWTGDPLELSTRVWRLFISGREVPLTSRQTRLRDRYLEGTGAPAPVPLR